MWFNALGRLALGQASKDGAVVADVGEFVWSGQSVGLSASILGVVGQFEVAGQAADLRYRIGRNLVADSGSLAVTGQSALFNVQFRSPVGEFVVSGQSSIRLLRLSAAATTFSTSGQSSARLLSVQGASGNFVFAGAAAGLDRVAPSVAGQFTLTGRAASVRRGLILYANNTAATRYNFVMFAPLGGVALGQGSFIAPTETTFSYSGQSVAFEVAARLDAGVGVFEWTRVAADLISTGYPTNIRIFPRVGVGLRGFSRGGGIRARGSSGNGARIRAFGG